MSEPSRNTVSRVIVIVLAVIGGIALIGAIIVSRPMVTFRLSESTTAV
jgi:hypothetical protein